MTNFIPLFPLRLVVYPGEQLNLHIFEPRYKQLIRECEEDGVTFGIPAYINDKLKVIGTRMELLTIDKVYENGELDIKTKGVGLFKIVDFRKETPGKLYSSAEIEKIEYDLEGNPDANEHILSLMKELFSVLSINRKLPKDLNFTTYDIGHHVGLNLDQEYRLLSILSEFERQEYIEAHLIKLIPVVRQMERLRERVKMNGHFKNIIPPEV